MARMASVRRRRPGRGVLISTPLGIDCGSPALPYEAGGGAVWRMDAQFWSRSASDSRGAR
jgi:hypothetical protein